MAENKCVAIQQKLRELALGPLCFGGWLDTLMSTFLYQKHYFAFATAYCYIELQNCFITIGCCHFNAMQFPPPSPNQYFFQQPTQL